jgi:hypothetical protein
MSFILSDYMDGGAVLKFTSVGGYPLYYITANGGVLSPEAVEENVDLCRDPSDPQWHVIGADINWDKPRLQCHHTGSRIESAYPEREER